MMDKYVLVRQYVAETFGAGVPVPGFWTVRAVWLEWFGPGGTRPRYDRSADGIGAAKVHVTVHRPGQVVALDTTPLPVKVRDGVFGDPVSAHLTLALDMFTHSAVAFRLTLVSDTAVDIAMLLRDIMMPLPMRDGWGPEMEWPYPGVPAGIVAEFAGHRVAGLPFFAPETVTTDHGGPYKSHWPSPQRGRWAATSCPRGCCGPRTRPLASGHSGPCGACCSSTCPAIPGSTSLTAARTPRPTRR